jgi:signal peptidase II
MFIAGRGGPLFAYSVPLVVSGAVGNLIDRARLNFVVDFIRFHVFDKWEYPTFNVADITIVVGVVLMVLDGFHKESQKKKQKSAEPPIESAPKQEPASKRRKGSGKKRKKKNEEGASEPAP